MTMVDRDGAGNASRLPFGAAKLMVGAFVIAGIGVSLCFGGSIAWAAASDQSVEAEVSDIQGFSFTMYDFGSSYLLDCPYASASNCEDPKDVASDCGLLYILANGCPIEEFPIEGSLSKTETNVAGYFITQVAIWLYFGLGEDRFVSVLPEGAKELVLEHAAPLAKEALGVRQKNFQEVQQLCAIHIAGTQDECLRLSDDRYESPVQKVTVLGGHKFHVAVEGLPRECVRNGDDVERSSFWSGEDFMVSVSCEDVTDDSIIKAVVSCETALPEVCLGESEAGERFASLGEGMGVSLVNKALTWTIPPSVAPDPFPTEIFFGIIAAIIVAFATPKGVALSQRAVQEKAQGSKSKGGSDADN